MSRTVDDVRKQLAATHLDYPGSRAVHDVELLLAEIDRLTSLNNALVHVCEDVQRNLETAHRDPDWSMTLWRADMAAGRIKTVLSATGLSTSET